VRPGGEQRRAMVRGTLSLDELRQMLTQSLVDLVRDTFAHPARQTEPGSAVSTARLRSMR
jgi:hypothetical protein